MDDNTIVDLFWERDTDAITAARKKYGSYCFSIANNILHSKEDSEECVNDTWLNAWNAIPPQKPTNLQMFLAKITRNLSFDRFKARTAQKRGGGVIHLVLDELAILFHRGRKHPAGMHRFLRSCTNREKVV